MSEEIVNPEMVEEAKKRLGQLVYQFYWKPHYEKNKEKILKEHKDYNEKNKEKRKEWQKGNDDKHKEKRKERQKEYCKKRSAKIPKVKKAIKLTIGVNYFPSN